MYLSSNLNIILKQRELSATDLSKAVGIPLSTLHNWINGVEPKSIPQLKLLSDYLEVSIEELCFNEVPKSVMNPVDHFNDEINAGVFEVVLRRVAK